MLLATKDIQHEKHKAASNTAHFLIVKSLQDFKVSEFGERFADFKSLEYEFSIFYNSFSERADEGIEQVQLELIELQ